MCVTNMNALAVSKLSSHWCCSSGMEEEGKYLRKTKQNTAKQKNLTLLDGIFWPIVFSALKKPAINRINIKNQD